MKCRQQYKKYLDKMTVIKLRIKYKNINQLNIRVNLGNKLKNIILKFLY